MSKNITQKERLLNVLKKNKMDRPPVICIGGMMNSAIVEIMKKTGHTLPEAHHDPLLMSCLALDVHSFTGFENIGIPFCMTVEPEVLGSRVNMGSLECEPKIESEVFSSVENVEFKDVSEMASGGRINVTVRAAKILSSGNPDIPVIGSLTGPVSTAASIVDPMTFYKELRKNRTAAHKVLDYVTKLLIEYSKRLIENGSSAIAVGDPSATGEILGPVMFEEYALHYLNVLADAVHNAGAPFILHICGDMKKVEHLLPLLHADSLSTDAMVNLKALKSRYPSLCTMGNLSTYTLQWGTPEKISAATSKLLDDGIDIISPACGLSTSTTLESIRAFTDTVKNS